MLKQLAITLAFLLCSTVVALGHHEHVENTFNVRDYGAVGDGATDDSSAIQAAIDAAEAAGGTVLIPDTGSTYEANALVVDTAGVTIKGDGTVRANEWPVLDVRAANITIEGITFDGDESGNTPDDDIIAVESGANYTTIRNCRFTNFTDAIRSDAADQGKIIGCEFDAYINRAVDIRNGSDYWTVTHNTANSAADMNVANHSFNVEANTADCIGNVLSNNNIYSYGTPMQLTGSGGFRPIDTVVSNNVLYNPTTTSGNGLKLDTVGPGTLIQSNSIYGGDYGIFDSPSGFSRLLDNIVSCDRTNGTAAIRIGSNSYNVIDTNWTDDGGGDLEVNHTGHELRNGDLVRILTSNTLPTGITDGRWYYVVNSATDVFELSLSPGGTPITFTDGGTGTHSVTWTPTIVDGNTIPASGGQGVDIANSARLVVVEDNDISNCGTDGINEEVTGPRYCIVRRNKIKQAGGYGVDSRGDGNVFDDNEITSCRHATYGCYSSGSNTTVRRTIFKANTQNFWRFDGATTNNLVVVYASSEATSLDSTDRLIVAEYETSAYTPTNVTTDRTYDANSTTLDEVADALGTLIGDLQSAGVLE